MSNEEHQQSKVAVSVAEMARMVGLSRARFYQLQRAGAFPAPDYDPETRRPFYSEEKQAACLEVRRRNCGVNGKAIMFYARRLGTGVAPAPTRRPRSVPAQRSGSEASRSIIDALKALGMDRVGPRDVAAALADLFPGGTANVAEAEVIRAVFLHLRRQNSGDNVGR